MDYSKAYDRTQDLGYGRLIEVHTVISDELKSCPRNGFDRYQFYSLAIAILSFMNKETYTCFPRLKTLEVITGLGREKIVEFLKILIEYNYLKCNDRTISGGRRQFKYIFEKTYLNGFKLYSSFIQNGAWSFLKYIKHTYNKNGELQFLWLILRSLAIHPAWVFNTPELFGTTIDGDWTEVENYWNEDIEDGYIMNDYVFINANKIDLQVIGLCLGFTYEYAERWTNTLLNLLIENGYMCKVENMLRYEDENYNEGFFLSLNPCPIESPAWRNFLPWYWERRDEALNGNLNMGKVASSNAVVGGLKSFGRHRKGEMK